MSNFGRVKSKKGLLLSKFNENKTELLVSNGISIKKLVATEFLVNPNDSSYKIHHIDGDITNNCVNNLAWKKGKCKINQDQIS